MVTDVVVVVVVVAAAAVVATTIPAFAIAIAVPQASLAILFSATATYDDSDDDFYDDY